MTTVELWFDPICPWSWLTSRWLLEAERVRDLTVRFGVMSLGALNDVSTEDVEVWGPVRLAIATELGYGPDALRALYTAFGTLFHVEGGRAGRDLYARALHAAELPHTLANAAPSPFYDAAVRESHGRAMAPLGGELGTPIIHVPGPGGPAAFFGPVVTPSPRGEAAGRLWDAVALAAGTDGFFELKRVRNREPQFD